MTDSLGDRMKEFYERRAQTFLLRRAYTMIRVDGKAFHTYTRGLDVPFDHDFMEDMNKTALALCEEIQGAQFAYVQSDEISILLTDFKRFGTDAWFDGSVQKMVSISASIATEAFNFARLMTAYRNSDGDFKPWNLKRAHFDSRVWQIPDPVEVANYFIWRQQDATRNSIQSAARAVFSHREVDGKSQNEMQNMLLTQKGINWNDYPVGCKRGRFIVRKPYKETVNVKGQPKEIERTKWSVVDPPIFSQDQEYLGGILKALREEMQV